MITILTSPKRIGIALVAAAMVGVTACSDQPATGQAGAGAEQGSGKVVAAFYPLQYAAEQVVGDSFEVTSLTTPGVDAHDLELSPSRVASITEADLVVYLKGFQPAVDEAVEQSGNTNVLDVSEVVDLLSLEDEGHTHEEDEGHAHEEEGDDHAEEDDHADHDHAHDHGDVDPHFWLDPLRMGKVAEAIADKLAESDPDDSDALHEGAHAMQDEMTAIDTEYTEGLQECRTRAFITSHTAFGYLADRYDLEEIGIAGISPDAEASPARIAEVQKLAGEHDINTIFFETLTSPTVAESIAGDLGIQTAVLDPLEGLNEQAEGDDYPSIMRTNLEALKLANGCS